MTRRARFLAAMAVGVTTSLSAQPSQGPSFERLPEGVALLIGKRRLEVRVCRDDIVRVVEAPPGRFFARESLAVAAGACRPTAFELQAGADALVLVGARLITRI